MDPVIIMINIHWKKLITKVMVWSKSWDKKIIQYFEICNNNNNNFYKMECKLNWKIIKRFPYNRKTKHVSNYKIGSDGLRNLR